ncbi:MAG: 50S ribosomal protein L25/general stress protein Ctc [Pseudomonadota bacterium]
MSIDFTLSAEVRSDTGKGASRRLRRDNKVPAILYGGAGEPVMLSLKANEVTRNLQEEAFYSHVLTLDVGGKSEQAILRDIQRHPSKSLILHMDFLRVVADQAITVQVPLHFINEETCVGVKMGGGLISHTLTELEVTCLPKDLPEYIEVDLADVDVGQSVHISDIALPSGVTSVALAHGEEHDLAVAAVNARKGGGGGDSSDDSSDDTEAGEADA